MYKLFNYSQVFLTLFIFFIKTGLQFPLLQLHHEPLKSLRPAPILPSEASVFLH